VFAVLGSFDIPLLALRATHAEGNGSALAAEQDALDASGVGL
jgi:hypothetical protein